MTAGIDLEKRDWLAFLAGYLSFSGTILVSLIALFQAKFFSDKENERRRKERLQRLQPIFAIKIDGIDTMIDNTAEVFNVYDSSSLPKHKNITFSIENVSDYPIQHVVIFDNYFYQLLKPNEKKTFQIAYSDSPDIVKWKSHLIEIYETQYERNSRGLPKWFNINYDDIDGNSMFQSFELKSFEDVYYYALVKQNKYDISPHRSTITLIWGFV